jgi:hypothetical protein
MTQLSQRMLDDMQVRNISACRTQTGLWLAMGRRSVDRPYQKTPFSWNDSKEYFFHISSSTTNGNRKVG